METTTTIPLTVTAEAEARIAELGMQSEFETMIEHTRLTVPNLRAIRAELGYDPCPSVERMIVIWAHRDDPGPVDDPTDDDWGSWKGTTFPPEVCVTFCMLSTHEIAPNGR